MTDSPSSSEPSGTIHRLTLAVLAGLGTVLVLIIAAAVIIHSEETPAPRPIVQAIRVSGTGVVERVDYLSVSPGIKPGADHQLHDAYSQTTFDVHAGRAVKLVIDNTDNVPHGIVSAGAGVDIIVKPGTHTYTLLVKKQGEFSWNCNQPCDPYSMSHTGYMAGMIIAD